MSQRQHYAWGKKSTSLFFPCIKTDECRCQQSCKRKEQGGSVMAGGGRIKTGWKAEYKKIVVKLSNICENNYCGWCTALFFLNTYIQDDNYPNVDIKKKKKTTQDIRSISSSLYKLRKGCLFIIYYVFKMFSVLAVLGQVIPKGTESPFLAVRLRRCWAWNPITGAAMPALWHQTLPMQNATLVFTTTNSLHSWVAAEEFTDGWPGWQGVGEMTPVSLM